MLLSELQSRLNLIPFLQIDGVMEFELKLIQGSPFIFKVSLILCVNIY